MAEDAPWLDGIVGDNPRLLIESDAKLIRVVAGPGAGKTTCLKRRIERLVQTGASSADKIFVGTFTRAIARDLQDALGEDIDVSTLHSLAYRLLRENPAACQGMKLRFLLAYEEAAMLHDVASSVPCYATHADRRRELRRLQSSLAERQSYHDAAFAGAVRQWLQAHGGMLVGEVVHLATVGLENHDIKPGEFDHVVVDEYQDLTAGEQQLVELIWSRNGSLVVMGDNNQSIYGFRWNHPAGVQEFSQRWTLPVPEEVTLPENRRCGEAILHVANLMMSEASGAEPMKPASGRPGDVALVHWSTSADEISGLAQYIKGNPMETFLVLVPRRFIGYRLKDAVGDDAQTAFHEEVLEHQIAQERFALASLLADPDDKVALRSWLGFCGNKPDQANRRNAIAYNTLPKNLSGHELIDRIASGSLQLQGSGQQNIRRRAEAARHHIARHLDLAAAIDLAFGCAEAKHESDLEKRRWLQADLEGLHAAASDLAANLPDPSLPAVMARLRYRIATRMPLQPNDDAPRVRIMTLHSAKGLESENIIIAGAADQLIPGLTQDPADIEEQRRLLYVAVTRAKNSLVVSWPRQLDYADAKANGVRLETISTFGGRKVVTLARTSLLPQSIQGAIPGGDWLAAMLPP